MNPKRRRKAKQKKQQRVRHVDVTFGDPHAMEKHKSAHVAISESEESDGSRKDDESQA